MVNEIDTENAVFFKPEVFFEYIQNLARVLRYLKNHGKLNFFFKENVRQKNLPVNLEIVD